MPRKNTPPPEGPAAPPKAQKPPRQRKARAPAPAPSLLPEDRALMGEALATIAERDGELLLALARKAFPDLTPPEERFFRNLGMVDFGDDPPDKTDETRTLRADRLAWPLLDRRGLRLLTPLGVMVRDANITGLIRR